MSQYLMRKRIGLWLASTATRNSLPTCALASKAATSWQSSEEDCTGATDKCPVLAQHAESGALVSTTNVLPEHGFLLRTPYVQLGRCR
jgi:hypothetical protein